MIDVPEVLPGRGARRSALPGVALLISAFLVSCGGGGASGSNERSLPTSVGGQSTAVEIEAVAITISDNKFAPDTVTAKVGQKIIWTWAGQSTHSVQISGVNSGEKTSGTFEQVYRAPATLKYQCGVHGAAMAGTIVVE